MRKWILIHNVFLPCRTTTTTAPTPITITLPPETSTDTTPVPEYEDFFVGSSSSEPNPTERKEEIDAGSAVYEDEYGNPIYVDENGEVYYPSGSSSSAEGSGGGEGAAYDDYGYYDGEYADAPTTLGPLETLGPLDTEGDEGEVFYETESGPRRDQQGGNSNVLKLLQTFFSVRQFLSTPITLMFACFLFKMTLMEK